jgi:hypothetical protein
MIRPTNQEPAMRVVTADRDHRTAPARGTARWKPIAGCGTVSAMQAAATKASQFAAMAKAYGPMPGMASSHDVVWRLQRHHDQPISVLAHWIVERRVIALEWQSQMLLPLFQFQLSDMSLCEPVVQVIHELSEVLDGWDLALWFALPNPWLQSASPVRTVEHDQPGSKQPRRSAPICASVQDPTVARSRSIGMHKESADHLHPIHQRRALPEPTLKPRTRYPDMSMKPAFGRPWDKPAWIFGFRH